MPPVEEIRPPDPSAIAAAPDVPVSPSDWPWWRGPNRNAHASGPAPPTLGKLEDHLIWKKTVPGRGHSTPTIWGDRIFVSTADQREQTQSVLCHDRRTGERLWAAVIHQGGLMSKHDKNSYASPTPACDGQRVLCCFAAHGALWTSAISMDGDLIWQCRVGDFRSRHGHGSSPVIYKSLILIAGDNEGPSYLVALDRESGDVVWRTAREAGSRYANHATPVVARVAGRDQLLLSGQGHVMSYDPVSGERLWTCQGPALVTANTVAWHEDLVFASGGYPEASVLCIRADGSGDVTETHLVWRKNFKAYVPSPLVTGDRLLVVRDNGVAVLLEAKTGDRVWEKRLGGDFSASPTLVEDMAFVPNERGRLFVFRVGDRFENLAQNDLGEAAFASPVICDGHLYLRGERHLYCIGPKKTSNGTAGSK